MIEDYVQVPLQFKPLTKHTVQEGLDKIDNERSILRHQYLKGIFTKKQYREELDKLNIKARVFRALLPVSAD
jgi:hypothetical protein